MKIPKMIKKNKKIYVFEKKYPNYYMYKNRSTGIKECFSSFDLKELKNSRSVLL